MKGKSLTHRQQQVLDFVCECVDGGRSVPSMREIAARLGLKSPSAPHLHMEALVRKGWLERPDGTARSLRVAGTVEKRVPGIPLLGAIPAGHADLRTEQVEKMLFVDLDTVRLPKGNRVFALRVTGDSMIGRHIMEGDIVVMEQGREPVNGDVVAALIDGQSSLKTFVKNGRKVFLRAENPRYPN